MRLKNIPSNNPDMLIRDFEERRRKFGSSRASKHALYQAISDLEQAKNDLELDQLTEYGLVQLTEGYFLGRLTEIELSGHVKRILAANTMSNGLNAPSRLSQKTAARISSAASFAGRFALRKELFQFMAVELADFVQEYTQKGAFGWVELGWEIGTFIFRLTAGSAFGLIIRRGKSRKTTSNDSD